MCALYNDDSRAGTVHEMGYGHLLRILYTRSVSFYGTSQEARN
jgi:hypothetical protein